MDVPTTRQQLVALLDKVGESQQLEYKSSEALALTDNAKTKITRAVSAMANAAGGLVIYGIAEYQEEGREFLPEKITPIDCSKFSREWLDQIIGLVQPRIEGLKIHDVAVGPNPSDYCYVVEIPQGMTAHQALDHRYYKRRNFEVTPMEDYEIRDVMNRRGVPEVTVDIWIDHSEPDRSGKLMVRFKNSGKTMARYFSAIFRFPTQLDFWTLKFQHVESMVASEDGKSFWQFGVSNGIEGVLFPGTAIIRTQEYIFDDPFARPIAPSIDVITITVFADDMKPKTLKKDIASARDGWT